MSRVKAEKSDVKILNRGKVAGKTKGPETPPPFQQGLIMGTMLKILMLQKLVKMSIQNRLLKMLISKILVKTLTHQRLLKMLMKLSRIKIYPGGIAQDEKISRETLFS